MSRSDETSGFVADTWNGLVARWRALDRGWQATGLGVALVLLAHVVA